MHPPPDISVVVPQAGCYCDHGNEESLYLAGMRSHWLPLAFSDTGLLCGVLLAACRSLTTYQPPSPANREYARMALRYRVECIRSTNDAIATEGTSVSDITIAKALIMCSDEVCVTWFIRSLLMDVYLFTDKLGHLSSCAVIWMLLAYMRMPLCGWSR